MSYSPTGAPVVDRRDGDAQVFGQLADIDQGLQAPRGGLRFGVHDEQVHRRGPDSIGEILRLAALAQDDGWGTSRLAQRAACQSDGFVMTGSNLTYEKIAETVEFPRFFGRADRI